MKLKVAGMQFLLSLFHSSYCILLSRVDCLKASFLFDLDIVTGLLISKLNTTARIFSRMEITKENVDFYRWEGRGEKEIPMQRLAISMAVVS